MPAKRFSLKVLLSSTTGILLTDIDEIYDLLGHMTGEPPFTHQLPRFNDECKPWLLRWFPELAPCGVEQSKASFRRWMKTDRTGGSEAIKMWLTELKMMFPELKDEYEVGQIPRDDHEQKNFFDELVEMRGGDEGIAIVEIPND